MPARPSPGRTVAAVLGVILARAAAARPPAPAAPPPPRRASLAGGVLGLAAALLTACAATAPTPPAVPAPVLAWHDAAHPRPSPDPLAADPMRVDAAMREHLRRRLGGIDADRVPSPWRFAQALGATDTGTRPGAAGAAADGAVARGTAGAATLAIAYDASWTRDAAQAFAERRGNCLSLALLTAALAREAGLGTTFNEVGVDEHWRRDGDLVLRSGHINLTLLPPLARRGATRVSDDSPLTIDFVAPGDVALPARRAIDEASVVALYFNNRAIELLGQGRLDDAYWHLRAALAREPRLTAARNTLAVLHERAGRPGAAAAVLASLLADEPDHGSALTNLARLHDAAGRVADAAALRQRRDRLEPSRPGDALRQGLAALARDDAATAAAWFEHELARHGPNAQAQWRLSDARWRLGERDAARRAIDAAVRTAPSDTDRSRYAAKLRWLEAQVGASTRPIHEETSR